MTDDYPLATRLTEAERNLTWHLAEKHAGSFCEDAEIDWSLREIDEAEQAIADLPAIDRLLNWLNADYLRWRAAADEAEAGRSNYSEADRRRADLNESALDLAAEYPDEAAAVLAAVGYDPQGRREHG